jgi:hypothetical protein
VRGPLGNFDAEERMRGFREGLAQCGLDLDPALVAPGAFADASGVQAVQLFVDERGGKFDAVIAANDATAVGVVRALHRRGVRVPEDVSVVGFDGFLEGQACDPPLTTLRQPVEEMAARCVEILLAQLAGEEAPSRVTLPTELTVRRSCGGRAREPRSRSVSPDVFEAAQARALVTAAQRELELGVLTIHLLAARSMRQVLDAIREFHGILSLKNLHLAVFDDDPDWMRLLLSTTLGDEAIRFRKDQLLPQGVLGRPECAFVFELRRETTLGRLVLECDAEHPRSLHYLATRLSSVLKRLHDDGAFMLVERERSTSGMRAPVVVGLYRVTRRIGQGGMATVYLGETESGQKAALKLIDSHFVNFRGGGVFQLTEEVRAAAISHPNVVSVFDVVFHEGGLYLAMDYVDGDSLAGIMRRAERVGEPIPVPIVGRILADMLLGLHAAHELVSPEGLPLGLIHRELSPENVLVGADGVSRITDFGIAKTRSSSAAAPGGLKGNVRYMAPEQALGMPLDRRCDLWAVGVIAWEALAGRRMRSKRMDVAVLLSLISEPPPLLSTVRPAVPQALERLMERVLRVNAEERFATAAECRDALLEAFGACGGIANVETTAHYVAQLIAKTNEVRDVDSEVTLTQRLGA